MRIGFYRQIVCKFDVEPPDPVPTVLPVEP